MKNLIVWGFIIYIIYKYSFGTLLGILFILLLITFFEILRGYKKILDIFAYDGEYPDYIMNSLGMKDKDLKVHLKKIFKFDLTARRLAYGHIIKEHKRIKSEKIKEEYKKKYDGRQSSGNYKQLFKLNDCIDRFELSFNYTTDDIKKAFKRLAKEYHPDRFTDTKSKENAEVIFKEINECKDKLLKG